MGSIIVPWQQFDEDPAPEPELTPDLLRLFVREVRRVIPPKAWCVDSAAETSPAAAALLAAASFAASNLDEKECGRLLELLAVVMDQFGATIRRCAVCHCSDAYPCENGCYWLDWNLCSACVDAGPSAGCVDISGADGP